MKPIYNPMEASVTELLQELRQLSDEKYKSGLKRFAIPDEHALGVRLPHIREFAKPLKKRIDRHSLAMELWATRIHEARILASMVADPKQLTLKEMDTWTHDFYSWDICDQCCGNLFDQTTFLVDKAFEYSRAKEEFVKRCGFVLMVQYVQLKKSDDEICLLFLKRIEEEAWDGRNFVKKAVNWCLRELGKRKPSLLPQTIDCAERLLARDNPSAKWIAQDALREFKSKGKLNQ